MPHVDRASFAPFRALRRIVARCARKGETVALVPTMGALHAGHLALVRLARRRADRVVVSIFVNPAQFAPNEDFASYPRTSDADVAALAKLGVDLDLGADRRDVMYPDGFATRIVPGARRWPGWRTSSVRISSAASRPWWPSCSSSVAPDFAMFGEKDYQQLKVVTAMARDLDLPAKIVGAADRARKGRPRDVVAQRLPLAEPSARPRRRSIAC